ncbi:hypothetical protein ACLOJK_034033 [Asimina triloba]
MVQVELMGFVARSEDDNDDDCWLGKLPMTMDSDDIMGFFAIEDEEDDNSGDGFRWMVVAAFHQQQEEEDNSSSSERHKSFLIDDGEEDACSGRQFKAVDDDGINRSNAVTTMGGQNGMSIQLVGSDKRSSSHWGMTEKAAAAVVLYD